MLTYYCEFSVKGETVGIYVEARNRDDARRFAWADIHSAVGDIYPSQPVLRSITLVRSFA